MNDQTGYHGRRARSVISYCSHKSFRRWRLHCRHTRHRHTRTAIYVTSPSTLDTLQSGFAEFDPDRYIPSNILESPIRVILWQCSFLFRLCLWSLELKLFQLEFFGFPYTSPLPFFSSCMGVPPPLLDIVRYWKRNSFGSDKILWRLFRLNRIQHET